MNRIIKSGLVVVTTLLCLPLLATSENLTGSKHIAGTEVKAGVGQSKKMGANQQLESGKSTIGYQNIANFKGKTRKVASGKERKVNASCIYQSTWSVGEAPFGLYEFNASRESGLRLVEASEYFGYSTVAGEYEGKYICAQAVEMWGFFMGETFYVIDLESMELERSFSAKAKVESTDLAYDSTSGTMYGCFIKSGKYLFGTLDVENGTVTEIKNYDLTAIRAMGCDNNGDLYAVDSNGDFVKIDKESGDIEIISSTGLISPYTTSGTVDNESESFLYARVNDSESALYSISLKDGSYSKLYDFENQAELIGMFIPSPAASEDAPAAVSNLSLDFKNGSLNGSVTFTTPNETYGGDVLSGSLTYHVYAGSEEIATGVTSCGMTTVAEVTVPNSGLHTIFVTVSNGAGESPKTKTKQYIGIDIPTAPTAALLNYEDGKMTLTWDASQSVNGGWIDTDKLSYNITRIVDGVEEMCVTEWKDTKYEETIPAPENRKKYKYSVKINYPDTEYATILSNTVGVGNILPPYSETFDYPDAMSDFNVIDANDDKDTWNYYSLAAGNGQMRMSYGSKPADDWLMTVGIKLEGNKYYRLGFNANAFDKDCPERLEVKLGTSANPDDMNVTLMPSTDLFREMDPFEVIVHPETDGIYYIGFHGISDANMFYLILDNITLSAPIEGAAPESVTDLKVVSDQYGGNEAKVSFHTPDIGMDGSDLTSIDGVFIKRDGVLVNTIINPEIGGVIEWVDKEIPTEMHTYSVSCTNMFGEGKESEVKEFVGLHTPLAPEDFNVEYTDIPGTMKFSWNKNTRDKYGHIFPEDKIRYKLTAFIDGEANVLDDNLSGSETIIEVVKSDKSQVYALFEMSAISGDERSESVASSGHSMAVGAPYSLPFHESAPNRVMESIWANVPDSENPAGWVLFSDDYFSDVKSQDSDNGFFGCKADKIGATGNLISGMISIPEEGNPGLTFHVFQFPKDTNEIIVEIREHGGYTKEIKTFVLGIEQDAIPYWNRYIVDLSQYKGKVIQVCFRSVTKAMAFTLLDNISISDLPAVDAQAIHIEAPGSVEKGNKIPVKINILNGGFNTVSNFNVELIRDGKVVESVPYSTTLLPGEQTSLSLSIPTYVTDKERTSISCRISLDGDAVEENNESETLNVTLLSPLTPTVTGLKATETESGAEIEWESPDLTKAIPLAITEDFESFDSFSIENQNGWKMIDNDGSPAGGFKGIDIPHLQGSSSGEPMAYIVMDSESDKLLGNNSEFTAHSGNKSLVSVFRQDNGRSDDWLISPELNGCRQTVSFYARSFTSEYPESFVVMVSDSSDDIDSFEPVAKFERISQQWTQFSVALPQGAKYFAIRCISEGAFAFFVDDFEFIPADGEPRPLKLEGYNVYCDDAKVNALPVTDQRFLLPVEAEKQYRVAVSAIYDCGESEPCDAILFSTSDVNSISDSGFKVSGEKGCIVIDNPQKEKLMIFDSKGLKVGSDGGSDKTVFYLPTGVYIVKSTKTMVKVFCIMFDVPML
ncbi:MAG: choice-of-anchor J domain-containing protein [Muribaculaceae bacterium]|nr:choice-of-anchor J domain-containing protein [Muribaculaceae bacterium]